MATNLNALFSNRLFDPTESLFFPVRRDDIQTRTVLLEKYKPIQIFSASTDMSSLFTASSFWNIYAPTGQEDTPMVRFDQFNLGTLEE